MTEQPPTTDRRTADRLVRRATCTVGVAATGATALIVGWLGLAHRTTTAAASVKAARVTPRTGEATSARATRHTASASTTTATTTTTTTTTTTPTETPSTTASQPVATSGGS